jgi:hypothetical protein
MSWTPVIHFLRSRITSLFFVSRLAFISLEEMR